MQDATQLCCLLAPHQGRGTAARAWNAGQGTSWEHPPPELGDGGSSLRLEAGSSWVAFGCPSPRWGKGSAQGQAFPQAQRANYPDHPSGPIQAFPRMRGWFPRDVLPSAFKKCFQQRAQGENLILRLLQTCRGTRDSYTGQDSRAGTWSQKYTAVMMQNKLICWSLQQSQPV